MRNALPILIVTALCTSGCATAARKIEQALRREPEKPDKREKSTARNRPAEAAEVRFAIKADHPRLFTTGNWPEPTDAVSRQWKSLLIKRADDTIDKPLIDYTSKQQLLGRSREALKRLSLLGGVYQMTHEQKYADAGRRELLNLAKFEDWQPENFLSTAEMMNAVAIGYDWLYDTLSPAERKLVVRAIATKGLEPALDAYASQGGWTRARHNWNCVCNGGVIVAALAIGNEEPALSRKVLGQALASIEEGMAAYDDNGGTAEGPMYHSYATRYLTFAAAAMETAITDEISQHRLIFEPREPSTGERPTGTGNFWRPWTVAPQYRINMTGNNGKVANFGDGSEILGNTAWMLWLAQFQNNHDNDFINKFEIATDGDDPSVFNYLWYKPKHPSRLSFPGDGPFVSLQTSVKFGSAIALRTESGTNGQSSNIRREKENSATFLALRTGGTADHHSHLDLGNFVLDMNGERFACDLGADNYDLPGYLGPRRADYLRSSTPGHNTLSIGNASQPLDAQCTAELAKDGRSATVDLTEAYPGARSVIRKAEVDDRTVTITDSIRLKRDATYVWNLHTPAKVKLTRDGALLDSNGKRVRLTVVSPKGAKLTAEPDETSSPELPVNDVTHLRLKVKVEDQEQIQVRFEPE